MKGTVPMIFLSSIVLVSIPAVAGDECDFDHQVLCDVQDTNPVDFACYGVLTPPPDLGIGVAEVTAIEPVAEDLADSWWVGVLIAYGGNGQPTGHTSFAFVGGVTDPDLCDSLWPVDKHSVELIEYWKSSVPGIICQGAC